MFGIFSYILNGTLYARPKILIPFLPLFILHCVRYLKSAHTETDRVSSYPLYPFAVMLPLGLLWFSQVQFPWILIELGILFLFCLIQRRKQNLICKCLKIPAFCPGRITRLSAHTDRPGRYVYYNCQKGKLGKESRCFGKRNLHKTCGNSDGSALSFDSLTEPLANGNRAPEAKITRSSMYSSVTNSAYSDLYYDVLNTPIRINNRIALLTSDNPFMLHLLGVRYIETEKIIFPPGIRLCILRQKTRWSQRIKTCFRMFILHRIQSLKKSLTVQSNRTVGSDFPQTIIENTSTDTDSDVYLPGKFITPFAPKLSADGKLPDSLTIKRLPISMT